MGLYVNRLQSIITSAAPAVTYTTSGLIFNLDSSTAPASGTSWTDTTGTYTASLIKSGTGNYSYTSNRGGGITTTGAMGNNGATIATNLNLPLTHSLEIVASLNTGSNYWASLFGNEVYGTRGFLAYFANDTSFTVGSVSGSEIYTFSAGQKSNINQYIFTVSGSTLKFYLNGTLQTKTTGTFVAPGSIGAQGLQIGSRHPNGGGVNTINDPAHGTYYMARAYNKALTQTEVTTNYNSIKTLYGI